MPARSIGCASVVIGMPSVLALSYTASKHNLTRQLRRIAFASRHLVILPFLRIALTIGITTRIDSHCRRRGLFDHIDRLHYLAALLLFFFSSLFSLMFFHVLHASALVEHDLAFAYSRGRDEPRARPTKREKPPAQRCARRLTGNRRWRVCR